MSTQSRRDALPDAPDLPKGVLVVRRGPGANCSSIGSVVDILFGAAVVGGAVWAAVMASLADRPIEVVTAAADEKDPDAKKEAKK